MRKKWKRMLFLLLSVILLITCMATPASAAAKREPTFLGYLSYWEAGSGYRIGRMFSPTVSYQNLDPNVSTYIPLGASQAVSQWYNVTRIQYADTAYSQNGKIILYGGTTDDIQKEVPGFFYGANGCTVLESAYVDGEYTYLDETKTYYVILKANCYVVCDTRSVDEIKRTATHEVGHALGFIGHSPDSSAVMYDEPSVMTLTEIDKRHLRQIYGYY